MSQNHDSLISLCRQTHLAHLHSDLYRRAHAVSSAYTSSSIILVALVLSRPAGASSWPDTHTSVTRCCRWLSCYVNRLCLTAYVFAGGGGVRTPRVEPKRTRLVAMSCCRHSQRKRVIILLSHLRGLSRAFSDVLQQQRTAARTA